MRILVTGATGLIGHALIPLLEARGHEILRLTRHASRESDIEWNPEADQLDLSGAGKLNGVVHLAGENIAEGRWTQSKKERILSSRKNGHPMQQEENLKVAKKGVLNTFRRTFVQTKTKFAV